MATKVLTTYKQKITGMELQPSSGGCFELSVNGKTVYSKLATGDFPNEDQLVAAIGKAGD